MQCKPQLAFHSRTSLAARSSISHPVSCEDAAIAACSAADLFGIAGGGVWGGGSATEPTLSCDGIHDDSIPGIVVDHSLCALLVCLNIETLLYI